ncbi:F-box/LRR-repeat protein [Trifolium medium]|uniref:F-box/LRR-repeat protein n=1 Tax=Trifolium medium TaxID=97028 RepID=A0A392NP56_9FABA|nr:F-box/LRR-repeat protein [Trifolium medium]
MQAFSQNITTLTSLTCSIIDSLNNCDLFLIAECFPLLQELDLSNPLNCQSSYPACLDDGVEALSLALIKLRKVNLSGFYMSNQSFFNFLNNCKLLEDVVMFKYSYDITNAGLASALRDRPTLRSLSISCGNPLHQEYRKLFATAHFIDSLVFI